MISTCFTSIGQDLEALYDDDEEMDFKTHEELGKEVVEGMHESLSQLVTKTQNNFNLDGEVSEDKSDEDMDQEDLWVDVVQGISPELTPDGINREM